MNYSAPCYVPIEITSKCNLNCKHCYGKFPRNIGCEITTQQIKDIIYDLYKIGVFRIEIGGGEPTLRDDFFEILEYASTFQDIDIAVVTNGILMNEELITKIKKINHKRIWFHVSVDGYDCETYGFLRNDKHAFTTLMHNIKNMLKAGLNVAWNVAIGKETVKYLLSIIDLGKEIGIKHIRLMLLYDTGRSKDNYLGFTFKEYQNFLKDYINGKYEDSKINIKLSLTQPFECLIPLMELGYDKEFILSKIDSLHETCMANNIYRSMTNKSCPAGRNMLAIDSQGDVHFCCMLTSYEEMAGGNVFNTSIKEIWDDSNNFKWIRNIQLEDLNTNCYLCKYKDICGGGCRARAMYNSGNFLDCDPLCPLVEYEYKPLTNYSKFVREVDVSDKLVVRQSQINDQDVFTLWIGELPLRVRKEDFGGSVFNSRGKIYTINQDGFTLLKFLHNDMSIKNFTEFLSNHNVSLDDNPIEKFENYVQMLLK